MTDNLARMLQEHAAFATQMAEMEAAIAREKENRKAAREREARHMRRIDESINRRLYMDYAFQGETQPFGGYLSKPETGQFDANGAYVPLWKRDPAFIRQQEDAMVDRLRDYRVRLEERKLIGA